MRRTLVTLALAGVPALILSACNGSGAGSGLSSALPNAPVASAAHHRMHRQDTGPQDLHAGGADFPGYVYNGLIQPTGLYSGYQPPPAAASLFAKYGGTGTIYYCLNSSSYGRAEFETDNGTATTACAALGNPTYTGFGGRQDPLDFVGSSTAMASTECCASSTTYYKGRIATSPSWGQPFEFPQVGGNIVFPFRPADFSSVKEIKLSTWTYCAIANGTVSNWNDGAITADNGGTSVTGGTSEPITFYFRADKSGTTYNLTNTLDTVCNVTFPAPYNATPYASPSRSAAWTFGVNSLWPGPGSSGDPDSSFIGEEGAPLILSSVQGTPYSTGYLEGAYAESADPKVSQAWLQNGGKLKKKKQTPYFVNPTDHATLSAAFAPITSADITYGGGSDGSPLGSTTPWCQLYISPSNFVTPPAKSYPIVAISYLLFYGNNNGVHLPDKTTLIKYVESSAANTIENKLEYASLSSSIETAVITALNGTASQAACLQ
jgi:ABC-type phosphate transport system substrate-binding protein